MESIVFRRGLGLIALAALAVSCNSHPVSITAQGVLVERREPTTIAGTQALDMLWVIDNSGSMCQEQKILRENFALFIEELNQTNLDFHIGVTTTDMNPSYPLEPVASPGLLQAIPQPVPGFDQSCQVRVNDQGQLVEGDYQPIKDAIAAAVACMATPDAAAFNWSDADIQCALTGVPMGCSIAGAGCGGGNAACQPEDLFPAASQYRNIPKVLRSADYKNTDGTLDTARLQDDFACVSLVGTRGYGIETGLIAAAEAVSLENTGGSIEVPENEAAPNHGFIRKDARFALIFVTDENDCSHKGSRNADLDYAVETRPVLDTMTACGGDICEIVNVEGYENSPLIPVEEIKQQFLENLAESKGRELGSDFAETEILVASIHGNSRRFAEVVNPETDCGEGGSFSGVSPTCATTLGVAFSGDRYERFLRTFPDGNYYPPANVADPSAALTGWMCTGNFGPALQAIGEFFIGPTSGCITRPIYPCEGAEDPSCPAFPYSGTPGACTLFGNTGIDGVNGPIEAQYYCNSGIQVRTQLNQPSADAQQRLVDTGYCIPESVNDRTYPNGCVIDPAKYSFVDCPSGFPGIKLEWTDGEIAATNALAGTTLELRYNSLTSSGEEE